MQSKFNLGDIVYLVESGRDIREVKIAKVAGGFYTVRFNNGAGGIKVRESRLFATREDAVNSVSKRLPAQRAAPRYKSPWDNQ